MKNLITTDLYAPTVNGVSWKNFVTIILLGKPANIALYSLGLNMAFHQIISLIH
jgi:uncharacterized membrane protein YdjX (TVP38/TMEM64 family)